MILVLPNVPQNVQALVYVERFALVLRHGKWFLPRQKK
jgi:hypothetical protein